MLQFKYSSAFLSLLACSLLPPAIAVEDLRRDFNHAKVNYTILNKPEYQVGAIPDTSKALGGPFSDPQPKIKDKIQPVQDRSMTKTNSMNFCNGAWAVALVRSSRPDPLQ